MVELLRRAALLIGAGHFLWLWLASPPAVLEVSRADFAGQYERQHGKRPKAANAAAESGGELIPETAHPGSVAAFVAEETAHRLLPPGDSTWTEFYRSLPPGAVYCAIDRPPFAALRQKIEAIFSRTQRALMYLPVRDGARTVYLEITYWRDPKETKAPTEVLHPLRQQAWPWLAGALLLYALIPWRRRGSDCAAYSRAAILALDALGFLFAAAFFALPLHVANSTGEVFGSEFGVALFLWAFGVPGLLMVLWAARLASFRVKASPSGLRQETLFGGWHVSYNEMSATGYLARQGIRTGIFIRRRDGGVVKQGWAGLLGFEIVLQAIDKAGVPKAEDMAV